MKIFHAYFSSASVLLFLGSSFFFEGTEDIVVYVFSPVWSFINNRRSQETYHLVFFFKTRKQKLCKISPCIENKGHLWGMTMKFRLCWAQETEKEIGNAGGTSDPHLFALIPRNQNQLNCVNLTVRGRCQPKAFENTFSLSPLMVCTQEVTYRCGHYQSICCYYNNTWKKSGIPGKKEHFVLKILQGILVPGSFWAFNHLGVTPKKFIQIDIRKYPGHF